MIGTGTRGKRSGSLRREPNQTIFQRRLHAAHSANYAPEATSCYFQATAAAQAGGVLNAILRADGGHFFIELETRTAGTAVLVTSNNRRPRAFRNPIRALEVIRELGVENGRFSLEAWRPDETARERASRPDRAEAMKQTHSNAAAHEKWFREQVKESLDDPRPNVSHAQVQKEMADKKAALRKRIAAGGASASHH
ncbi:hypothetical protein [Caballeronia ptereochthonis]|uniref:Uncharacterized protein n=1 Tax=Caballeronia ptereochthonis TaxID=1777144 RepID=A0A158DYE8_9BURK|nr:hypothetical protein [Caballeronia ptereochthonis]SAK99655.1 hypothetical protein AWB83_06118 [Caballeronia ptereochthonis]